MTRMWEAVAAPGRRDDLAAWAAAQWADSAVYVSADDRVVVVAEDAVSPDPEPPAEHGRSDDQFDHRRIGGEAGGDFRRAVFLEKPGFQPKQVTMHVGSHIGDDGSQYTDYAAQCPGFDSGD